MNGLFKQLSLWIVFFIIILLVVAQFRGMNTRVPQLWSKHFEEQLEKQNIKSIEVRRSPDEMYNFSVEFKEPAYENVSRMEFESDAYPPEWKDALKQQGIPSDTQPERMLLTSFLFNILPIVLIFGFLWFFMFRQMQGGSNKAMSFGKSRARRITPGDKTVTFKDVAGVDEAKEELQEIIEFLRDPKKFTRLGGKIPKGVLLVGPPGTGKTLLARAVAGEANVPFFSISGSDFVEMFVGVGASRVRDLFQQGEKNAPCIIFIDEIDAVGRQRGAGLGGGHDEREQTLNALLVEMDGFNTNEGVILMAATNRPDVLDKALLRPGRFDRQIMVTNPDITGREAILEIHIKNNGVPLADDVDVRKVARGTPGFSGADLANLVNEGALLAARRGHERVTRIDFEDAKDRVLMGPERKSLVISPKEKKITAVHEAGHALVCRILPEADPVHKVTIIPRGPSLGLTSWLPEEDRHNVSKKYCLAMIRVAMGGRAAEDVVFDEFTSGASGDLRVSTQRAHAMVCEWGMSELGPISFGSAQEVFLGRDFAREREYSDETASAIDNAIHTILEDAYRDAKEIMVKHRRVLDAIADELMERETIDGEQLEDIIRRTGGSELIPPKERMKTPIEKVVRPIAAVIDPPKKRSEEGPELAPGRAGGILPDPA